MRSKVKQQGLNEGTDFTEQEVRDGDGRTESEFEINRTVTLKLDLVRLWSTDPHTDEVNQKD